MRKNVHVVFDEERGRYTVVPGRRRKRREQRNKRMAVAATAAVALALGIAQPIVASPAMDADGAATGATTAANGNAENETTGTITYQGHAGMSTVDASTTVEGNVSGDVAGINGLSNTRALGASAEAATLGYIYSNGYTNTARADRTYYDAGGNEITVTNSISPVVTTTVHDGSANATGDWTNTVTVAGTTVNGQQINSLNNQLNFANVTGYSESGPTAGSTGDTRSYTNLLDDITEAALNEHVTAINTLTGLTANVYTQLASELSNGETTKYTTADGTAVTKTTGADGTVTWTRADGTTVPASDVVISAVNSDGTTTATKLSNVANGTEADDAATVGQLRTAIENVTANGTGNLEFAADQAADGTSQPVRNVSGTQVSVLGGETSWNATTGATAATSSKNITTTIAAVTDSSDGTTNSEIRVALNPDISLHSVTMTNDNGGTTSTGGSTNSGAGGLDTHDATTDTNGDGVIDDSDAQHHTNITPEGISTTTTMTGSDGTTTTTTTLGGNGAGGTSGTGGTGGTGAAGGTGTNGITTTTTMTGTDGSKTTDTISIGGKTSTSGTDGSAGTGGITITRTETDA